MSQLFRNILAASLIGLGLGLPQTVMAQQDPQQNPMTLLPERRLDLTAGYDMPGGDLGPIFDTTLQACVNACLNLDSCNGLTFNGQARACFPKDDRAGAPTPFAAALSGRMVTTPAESMALASRRANAAARFITESDRQAARAQALSMAAMYPPGDELDPAAASARAEAIGDVATATRMTGLVTAQRDRPEDWSNLARLMLTEGETSDGARSRSIAMAATNAYLRADDDATAARALNWLAAAYERMGRGQDGLGVLRLAAGLAPNDAGIADALQKSQDRNGMRVTDSQATTDSTNPRYCVTMSRQLNAGLDYADFLRLPAQDMTVTASGRDLCISGLTFGQELEITLRAGLPASDGEVLARDVTLRSYIRDRDPSVRFPGRAYVLPSGGDQGLGVVTVNADLLDLVLMRMSDRNLLRTMSEGMFATPLDSWEMDYFGDRIASTIWKGTAAVPQPADGSTRNAEVTTRLPIAAEAGDLAPGIYVLQATVTGENPGDTGAATQWFVISDFGISTLSGNNGLTVAVRSLATTRAVQGAEVALISRANEVLARAATDDQGIVRFAPGLSLGRDGAAPALLTVTAWQGQGADRAPTDMAFLSLTDPEFDLSDRGVEGQPPAPPIDVFATTDRGAYRVGETINATVLARDTSVHALAQLPLTGVILRPDGVEQARVPLTDAGAGGYVLSWTLPANAPRGTWRLDIRAEANGPALASARVLVEDFLPERIDFTPTVSVTDGADDAPATAGQPMRLSLDARWLFGAPAAELPVEGALWMVPRRTLDAFAGYSFGRHDSDAQPTADSIPGGATDAQGHFQTDITLPDAETLGQRPVEARLTVNVREGAGRPVERSTSKLVMPDQPIPGIRPLFEDMTVAEGTEARFALIAAGPDLQPQAAQINWVVNRVETQYEWYSLNGQWQWEAITRRNRIGGGTVETGNTPAEIAVPVEWGSYELVAEIAGEGGAGASTSFYAGWGVASSGTDTPDRLKVALDKPAYRSGDTARVTVDALADGTGIVSVLSGDIVSLQMVDLKAGENTIDLPVTDEWGAGVYVTVSAIRPLDNLLPGDRMPARALGLAHAAVDPGNRALKASLEIPTEIRPRGNATVTLRVDGAEQGETVHATIAAVDQGILNLTSFTPPDPSKHYFGQRRLGVALRDLYGRLILPTGAPDGALREGGDAQVSGSDAPPPTEKLMSWFSGPVTLGPDGTAQVDIPVPDFNGEIRVMAVVWSQTGIGQADATILSRDPVVMTVTAPAFLAPGDSAEIGLRLTHASGPAGQARIAITQTEGDAAVDAAPTQDSVTLTEKGEARLNVPITAQDRTGLVRMRLTLTTPGGEELTKDIAMLVAMNEPDIQRQDRLVLAPGASLTVPMSLTQGLMPGADLSMAVGNYAKLDVAGALAALERYPYGCTEQTTSVALPLLYLPRLSVLEGIETNNPNPTSIEDAVARILTRQTSGGSFGMWSADSGDLWLDAYVTDFLSRARETGHQVPDNAFRSAIDNLRNRVNYATDPNSASADENAALAYAVAVLARERAATIGDLRYYADTAPEAFRTPMSAGHIGAALAAYGDQPRADAMFGRAYDLAMQAPPEKRVWRSDYGTYLRDKLALLSLASEAGSTAFDLNRLTLDVAEQLARQQENRIYRSTQELVWSVLAAESLSEDASALTLNGAALSSAVATLPEGAALANPGTTPIEVTLTATGQPLAAPAAGGKGYAITRDYYSMEGAALDPAEVGLGTRMVTVVTVRPDSSDGGRLMVTDPLPAGFEIDNPNLLQAGDISALSWLEAMNGTDMAEFRQDRFAASLSWSSAEPFRLAYIVRAVTPGTFRHPAASVEDMYRPEFRAWTDGGTVRIAP
ncbi:alpha-2-macroglobulin family protein [Paracoccus sp. DMF-8]|uniref:alpha-2-macroglobulin family protein n=1 Tax=Paracoccus sp. DMF-8 TaxID=3019445 RepID=UPI0023E7A465|nr:alpha-2-macroglobulin family protein [Paracoccus sp. DMF-8]MDF3606808.1 alpha-2-macroglobulin family protein [Paracoccus sp. DMF-8]